MKEEIIKELEEVIEDIIDLDNTDLSDLRGCIDEIRYKLGNVLHEIDVDLEDKECVLRI